MGADKNIMAEEQDYGIKHYLRSLEQSLHQSYNTK